MSDDKNLVVKSNELNSYTFYKNATELKIFSRLIIEIRKDIKTEKSIYKISVKDLMDSINFKANNYTKIKNVASNMFWKISTKDQEWEFFDVIFTRINIKHSWYIEFKINEDIRPHITNLSKDFMWYFLENIADIKNHYVIRIYELLIQFRKSWKAYLTIEKIRENLKIEKNQYKMYWHFKDRILKKAQKELKEKTDINFTFEEHKTGKRVDRLTFYIWENIKSKISSEEKKKAILPPLKSTKKETKEQLEIIKLWTEKLKLDNQFLNEIFKTYEGAEKRILDNLKHTIKKFEQGKIKESLGGYFRTALKNDYAKQMQLLDPKEEQKKQAIREENKILAANELYKKFNTYKAHKIEVYKKVNSKELKNLVPIFIIKNLKILELNKIDFENIEEVEKATKEHKFIKSNFDIFIEKTKLKNDILTFEEWAKNQNIDILKNTNWDYIIK